MTLWVVESSGTRDGVTVPDKPALRLGVVAGKKVGNAVKRAAAKRRMRETWRTSQDLFHGPCDMILSARAPIDEATPEEIRSELLHLAKKAGLLK